MTITVYGSYDGYERLYKVYIQPAKYNYHDVLSSQNPYCLLSRTTNCDIWSVIVPQGIEFLLEQYDEAARPYIRACIATCMITKKVEEVTWHDEA